jgi:hypothetical protein
VVESVVKINPEAAVKLEDRERPIGEIALGTCCRSNRDEQKESQ